MRLAEGVAAEGVAAAHPAAAPPPTHCRRSRSRLQPLHALLTARALSSLQTSAAAAAAMEFNPIVILSAFLAVLQLVRWRGGRVAVSSAYPGAGSPNHGLSHGTPRPAQVLTMLPGVWYTRRGTVNTTMRRALSSIAFNLLLPCVVFINVAGNVSASTIGDYWPFAFNTTGGCRAGRRRWTCVARVHAPVCWRACRWAAEPGGSLAGAPPTHAHPPAPCRPCSVDGHGHGAGLADQRGDGHAQAPAVPRHSSRRICKPQFVSSAASGRAGGRAPAGVLPPQPLQQPSPEPPSEAPATHLHACLPAACP